MAANSDNGSIIFHACLTKPEVTKKSSFKKTPVPQCYCTEPTICEKPNKNFILIITIFLY